MNLQFESYFNTEAIKYQKTSTLLEIPEPYHNISLNSVLQKNGWKKNSNLEVIKSKLHELKHMQYVPQSGEH